MTKPSVNEPNRNSPSPKGRSGGHFGPSNLSDVCSWQWDLKTNRVCWSSQLCNLLGIEPRDIPPGTEDFLRLVHPEFHDLVRQDIKTILSGLPFEHELCFLPATGGVLRVRTRGIPISDRSGQVVSVVGLCWPLTPGPSLGRPSRNADLLLAQAEEIANFGSWEFNVDTRKGTLSAHLAKMLDMAPGAQLSEDEYWSRVHPEDRPRVLETAGAATANQKPFQYVARYIGPGGTIRHHLVRGLPSIDENGVANSIVGIILDFSDQTHAEGELHRLSQQLLRARDEERRNVARELHESTGQTLAALKMSLGRLREALPEEDEVAHSLLRSAVDLADDAVREVRTLSYLMHPPMLDEAGLPSALRWYVKGFAERSGISVQVDIPEDFGRHGQEIETTVFRIVQEALTNVHRYSGSRIATICLGREGGYLSAEVHDEGCGLPAPASSSGWGAPPGVGIVGMRERVKQLNGRFEMESAPGKGTTVRVVLPVDRQPQGPV
jgi:signal transduction histidine kinase